MCTSPLAAESVSLVVIEPEGTTASTVMMLLSARGTCAHSSVTPFPPSPTVGGAVHAQTSARFAGSEALLLLPPGHNPLPSTVAAVA